ncbi:MAG: hypothetical protein ACTHU0_24670 [Kofleriaceae bacterium]
MTPCPTCQKPVDPLRARHVSVRDGKVVAYCSPECQAVGAARDGRVVAAAATRAATPEKPARTPPGGVRASASAQDSGPVIEILHEPASGVVTSARDERRTSHVVSSHGQDSAAVSGELGGDDTDDGEDGADEGDERDDDEAGQGAQPDQRRRRDSRDAKAAWDWIDEEPVDPAAARGAAAVTRDRSSSGGGSGGKALAIVLAAACLGGGGYLVYRYLSAAKQETAAPSSQVTPAPAPSTDPSSGAAPTAPSPGAAADPAPADAPAETSAAALDRARAALVHHLESGSPRVQHKAAAALARTGDPVAITVLAAALGREKIASRRIELAYQLARAGDPRGGEALAAALRSSRRDDKLDAGKDLARLGDRRAAPVLLGYLEVSQHRLSSAEWLARLAEPAALAVLDQIRGDARATPDDKARAAVALGIAGRAEVAGELRALLDDKRFNAYAAVALAELRDEAARPVLVDQLGVSALRVEAARALRRLAPEAPLDAQVASLAAALDANRDKDTEQIPIAEAILLLAGPASWSERP